MSCGKNCGQCSGGGNAVPSPFNLEALRDDFAAIVKTNLGDIAVMDEGRYISPKINSYWVLFTETVELLVKKMEARVCSGHADQQLEAGPADEELGAVDGCPSNVRALDTNALIRAALNCAHEIDDSRVVLRYNPKVCGNNALDQLGRRLNEVVARTCPKVAVPEREDAAA